MATPISFAKTTRLERDFKEEIGHGEYRFPQIEYSIFEVLR